jgi:hypothetical protein
MKELISMELSKDSELRLMGFYPELKFFVYAIETDAKDFGVSKERETYLKYFDVENAQAIGQDYLNFIKTERGVIGLRGGDVLAYYQVSMQNAYAIDSRSNYNSDVTVVSAFAEALVTPDKKRVVYTFEYEPKTQGVRQNKILVSDLFGGNRHEIMATEKNIDLLEILSDNSIKVRVDEEEQILDF